MVPLWTLKPLATCHVAANDERYQMGMLGPLSTAEFVHVWVAREW
jgi:hypothetical protein